MKLVTAIRWTARIVGTAMASILFAAIVVAILFGGGDHFDPLTQLLRGKLLFTGILTTVAGLLVAWKWERTGGLFILGGLAFLVAVTGDFPPNPIFVLTLLTGLLHLGCGFL
jgi:hypothetical protein